MDELIAFIRGLGIAAICASPLLILWLATTPTKDAVDER